ncbi:MAG TPA: hypothetical protein VIL25_00815 [Vicinamibacterales bacterium]|mgnify:CR=1 FL=1
MTNFQAVLIGAAIIAAGALLGTGTSEGQGLRGIYEIEAFDGVAWRLNTITGEASACIVRGEASRCTDWSK